MRQHGVYSRFRGSSPVDILKRKREGELSTEKETKRGLSAAKNIKGAHSKQETKKMKDK